MAYKIPSDLPRVPATWQDWSVEARLRAALGRADPPVWASLAAVTITMVEQPGQIPVNNCCGIMCQGERFPWGWAETTWDRARPIGYALLNEGQGVKGAPFLAFAQVSDSLNFLIDRCVVRGISGGKVYAAAWVGLDRDANPRKFDATVAAYEVRYDRVIAALWKDMARLAMRV